MDDHSLLLRIHSYESLGTCDGPGIRLVVFLQGCNFRCLYCANPDTIHPVGESRLTDPAEVLRRALSEKPFFGRKGGVTFSGGEPTLQAHALVPLFRQLHEAGIHTCLDTNGGVWNPHVEQLFGLTDLFLLDVKEFDDTRHRALTSRSNSQTLATARWLEAHGKPFWLRYVLVPGHSAFREDMEALADSFAGYRCLQRVEILPYHTLGTHKYQAMGLHYPLGDTPLNTPEQIEEARRIFSARFSEVRVN